METTELFSFIGELSCNIAAMRGDAAKKQA